MFRQNSPTAFRCQGYLPRGSGPEGKLPDCRGCALWQYHADSSPAQPFSCRVRQTGKCVDGQDDGRVPLGRSAAHRYSRPHPCLGSHPCPLPLLSPRRYIPITPENVGVGGNVYAPLSFVSISSGPRHGAFIVAWSNMLLGADYDMDIVGFIRYDLVYNPDNAATGWDVKVTTDIVNVCGAQRSTFGFSINGVKRKNAAGNLVDASGRYLTHQHGDRGSEEGTILAGMPPTSHYPCGDKPYI